VNYNFYPLEKTEAEVKSVWTLHSFSNGSGCSDNVFGRYPTRDACRKAGRATFGSKATYCCKEK
jgi:hypothetical protein